MTPAKWLEMSTGFLMWCSTFGSRVNLGCYCGLQRRSLLTFYPGDWANATVTLTEREKYDEHCWRVTAEHHLSSDSPSSAALLSKHQVWQVSLSCQPSEQIVMIVKMNWADNIHLLPLSGNTTRERMWGAKLPTRRKLLPRRVITVRSQACI